MDWYWKAALIVSLIWGAARALGVYGQAERDLDLSFLFAFLLSLGGWGAVFYVSDRVAKFLGWKRPTPNGETTPAAVAPAAGATSPVTPSATASARSSRRKRR